MDPIQVTDLLFDECIKIIKKIDLILISLNHESKITTREEILDKIADIRTSIGYMEKALTPRERKGQKQKKNKS